MNYEIEVSELARDRIADILAWQLLNVSAESSAKLTSELDKFKTVVSENPLRYPPFRKVGLERTDLHIARVYHHLIVYVFSEVDRRVKVLTIRHERQHPRDLLKEVNTTK